MPTMIRPASWPSMARLNEVLSRISDANHEFEMLGLETYPLFDSTDPFEPLEDAPVPTLEDIGALTAFIERARTDIGSMVAELENFKARLEAAVYLLRGGNDA